jgi:hypothetical protein
LQEGINNLKPCLQSSGSFEEIDVCVGCLIIFLDSYSSIFDETLDSYDINVDFLFLLSDFLSLYPLLIFKRSLMTYFIN